jgi:hypothetical protein
MAGEDDLDAPDLPTSTADKNVPGIGYPEQMANETTKPSMIPMARDTGRQQSRPKKPALNPEASEQLRDKLVSEIERLDAVEAAIEWAAHSIEDKNCLSASDASWVEAVFEGRMRVLQPEVYSISPTPSDTSQIPAESVVPALESERGQPSICKISSIANISTQRPVVFEAAPTLRQRSPSFHCRPAMHGVWPTALRGSPSTVRATARTRPQSIG